VVRFTEVSHQVEAGMKTYPGLPEPTVDVIIDYESSRERYGNKAEFFIASLHPCGNTGTYVDSPHHRYPRGADLAELPLERLAHMPAVVIDATGAGRAIGPELFGGIALADRAVLVRTDFSRPWGSPACFTDHPYLTTHSVEVLVRAGPRRFPCALT
jgi:kynurenine formamidase